MTDFLLELWVSALIELSKLRSKTRTNQAWSPGQRLKLLLMAYNGARNTGEDVRTQEMIRQFQRVLGAENLDLSVLTFDPARSSGYFEGSSQVSLPSIFPPFLWREIPKYDGVVTAKGALFQHTFANASTALMIGAMGLASNQGRMSIAYGVEAGQMDKLVAKMTQRYCANSLLILRNPESQETLRNLGVPSELGTDVAWTFEPLGAEYGQRILRKAGWDGAQPVLAVCPNRPFSWPVRASIAKAAARLLTGAYSEDHYRSIYFHNSGAEAKAAYRHYISGISSAVDRFRKERKVFPILVGMERLDEDACERISDCLGRAPVITSDQYNMFELVGILRCCHMLVSTRYHAIVTSMPALVPSAGVSMDQRIVNLMRERGQPELVVSVTDQELEPRLFEILSKLDAQRECIADGIGRTVAKNVKAMAQMGMRIQRYVKERYPELPVRCGGCNWKNFVPPLSASLQKLVETYEPRPGD